MKAVVIQAARENIRSFTLAMVCVGVSFTEQTDGGNYYIVEFIESAPYSAMDLRGH